MEQQKAVKLHLGCQEKYLEGYINIDLPPSEHTAQEVKADLYADVRDLDYPAGTVDEIRSHHLLEHFSRQEALLLLSRWHRWLKVGGLLVVETPDFEESAKKFVGANIEDQFVLGRHIFGSHEAGWAYHKDFWSEPKYRYVLDKIGFGEMKFDKFSNNLESKIPISKTLGISKAENVLKGLSKFGFNFLPNIVCYAKKTKTTEDYHAVIKDLLEKSMVGREVKILDVWLNDISGKI